MSYAGRPGEIPPAPGQRQSTKTVELDPSAGRPYAGPMPAVSVVIPTYERLDVLPEVLAGLAAQRAAPAFEVVVVDDGSQDATPDFLAGYRGPLALHVLRQQNHGPAAARNAGVAAASGELVAFLGDDTVPEPGWLAAHAAAHEARRGRGPLAVLGYTGWHRRMRMTPFLRYINEHGLQFGYALIDEPEKVPFNFFYTSNVSLPRALLLAEPFDLALPARRLGGRRALLPAAPARPHHGLRAVGAHGPPAPHRLRALQPPPGEGGGVGGRLLPPPPRAGRLPRALGGRAAGAAAARAAAPPRRDGSGLAKSSRAHTQTVGRNTPPLLHPRATARLGTDGRGAPGGDERSWTA